MTGAKNRYRLEREHLKQMRYQEFALWLWDQYCKDKEKVR
jgi:hypothetical protein